MIAKCLLTANVNNSVANLSENMTSCRFHFHLTERTLQQKMLFNDFWDEIPFFLYLSSFYQRLSIEWRYSDFSTIMLMIVGTKDHGNQGI